MFSSERFLRQTRHPSKHDFSNYHGQWSLVNGNLPLHITITVKTFSYVSNAFSNSYKLQRMVIRTRY